MTKNIKRQKSTSFVMLNAVKHLFNNCNYFEILHFVQDGSKNTTKTLKINH